MTDVKKFVLYDASTGEIVNVYKLSGIDESTIEKAPGQKLMQVDTHMDLSDRENSVNIASKEIEVRPSLSVQSLYTMNADGVEELVIYGIPTDTRISFMGSFSVITDGSFEFITDRVGEYSLILMPPFPHQKAKVMINAV